VVTTHMRPHMGPRSSQPMTEHLGERRSTGSTVAEGGSPHGMALACSGKLAIGNGRTARHRDNLTASWGSVRQVWPQCVFFLTCASLGAAYTASIRSLGGCP
jgi:hypothetical protein